MTVHPIFQNILATFAPKPVSPIQALYDKLSAPSFDSAGYRIEHKATVADVEAQLAWLRNAVIERKAEIDASVEAGRNPQIIDQMRAEFRSMASLYDEASDELEAITTLKAAE